MTHISFQDAHGKPLELEADYVVIGSGAGGASAAVTLARGGASVAIVEAGPWRDPTDYPHSMYGAMRDLFDGWGATITRGRAFWPIVQGSAVGGTTVINSAIRVRTPEDVFDLWQREYGVGGAPMAKAFDHIQDELDTELCTEIVPEGSRGRLNELAMLGANRMGYDSHYLTRYVKGCLGSGQCLQGCRSLKKQSLNLNFIPEVRRRGGTVLSSAPVHKVIFEGTRAVGAVGQFVHPQHGGKGARFTVRAKKAVVVAASATHSPVLLKRSGVVGPAVGGFFRAHPGTSMFGVYEEPVDMTIGATQGWASTAFRLDPGIKLETLGMPPEMVASRISGGGAQLMERLREMRHFALWVHAVRAESVGSVHAGWGTRPIVRYTLNAADMHRMRAGLVILAKTHFAAGATAVIPGIHGYPFQLGPDDIHVLENTSLEPRDYVGVLTHLFGGCVMGKDPRVSVCDGRGKVHGYESLYIADASALPSTLGVNPQHTIMALARHFMEQLQAA